MKLLRVGAAGQESPALLDSEGVLRDLSGLVADIDGALLADQAALGRIRAAAGSGQLPALDAAGLRIGAPLARIGKIVCIGLNYFDHAKETGAEPPDEPVIFLKAADTVVGPNDTVLVPRGSVKTDWEIELAVVIGRTARYLDEVADPQGLALRLWVNGELKQDGTTAEQIFPVGEIVRYVSQFMTLYPGDVINTGTPAGVALGQPDPKPFPRPGDVVELEVERLGRQRQELKGGAVPR